MGFSVCLNSNQNPRDKNGTTKAFSFVFSPVPSKALQSDRCLVITTSSTRVAPFHGGNTGSNPIGDANIPKHLHETLVLKQGPLGSNKLLDCRRDGLCCANVRQNQL